MGRIVLTTWGTHGDVLPLAILGAGLQRAGHSVLVVGPPDLASVATQRGLDFEPCGSPIKPAVERAGSAADKRLESNRASLGFLRQQIQHQLDTLPGLLEGADLLLGASLAWGAHSSALRAGVPYRFVAYGPQLLPASDHPPIVIRKHGRAPWRNRLDWKFFSGISNMMFKKTLNQRHAQWGLPPVTDVVRHFLGPGALLACDPVFGSAGDCEVPTQQVAALQEDPAETTELSDTVREFLGAGEPPVFGGFGSMPGGDATKTGAALIAGAREAGRRIILGSGWGGLNAEELGPDVLVIDYEPFSALFPQVAAVIHHGGAGTTATAARAGVPQIIVPHMGDQFYFGHRVHRAGIGPEPLELKRLRPRTLADRLRRTLEAGGIREEAVRLGQELGGTSGVEQGVRFAGSALSG